jgi:hypothetical protein
VGDRSEKIKEEGGGGESIEVKRGRRRGGERIEEQGGGGRNKVGWREEGET